MKSTSTAIGDPGSDHLHESPPATIRPDQALEILGLKSISRRSFYNAIGRNEVPHVRVGRRILIPRLKFLRWAGLEQRQEEPKNVGGGGAA